MISKLSSASSPDRASAIRGTFNLTALCSGPSGRFSMTAVHHVRLGPGALERLDVHDAWVSGTLRYRLSAVCWAQPLESRLYAWHSQTLHWALTGPSVLLRFMMWACGHARRSMMPSCQQGCLCFPGHELCFVFHAYTRRLRLCCS